MSELTIAICTRNRAQSLGPMLDALRLVRSERAWELLLIDNGSTDNTKRLLDDAVGDFPNARVETVTAIGLGSARDAAWRMAASDIILFTDDDCYAAPDIVDAALAAFERYRDAGVIGGQILLHDPSDYPVTIDERTAAQAIAPRIFAPPGTLQGANFAFRREVLEAIGGIDTNLGAGTPFPCEDIDAVAACLWAGYAGQFEPSVVIRHHHGRKQSDYASLMQSYDKGRGAYYAKYLLRSDSRGAYFSGWLKSTFANLHRGKLDTLRRELASAARYCRSVGAWPALVLGAPVAAVVYAALVVAVAGNKVLTIARRNTAPAVTKGP